MGCVEQSMDIPLQFKLELWRYDWLGEQSLANFEYSGWLTEANHLGNVAYRVGKKIHWDPVNLKCTNAPEAEPFIRREYRDPWKLA